MRKPQDQSHETTGYHDGRSRRQRWPREIPAGIKRWQPQCTWNCAKLQECKGKPADGFYENPDVAPGLIFCDSRFKEGVGL